MWCESGYIANKTTFTIRKKILKDKLKDRIHHMLGYMLITV